MKQNNNTIALLIIIGVLLIATLSLTIALIYKSINPNNPNNNSTINVTKQHIPVKLGPNDVLVSFRLDDVTFTKTDKPVLENALYLARKYNITFDLAVIAQPFDEKADPEVFKIYQDNQDVFEVVAHGWDHKYSAPNKGEFNGAPYKYQEEHIKKMKEIFVKHNLTMATKIFIVPWNSGDENTNLIADLQGYQILSQVNIPTKYEYSFGNLTTYKARISIPLKNSLEESELKSLKDNFYFLTTKDLKMIQIVTHPINYDNLGNSDKIIKDFVDASNENPRIKLGMISDVLDR